MTARTDAPAAWSALLADAVSRPGVISEAYSRFWNYSVGNQLLALWQCFFRGIAPGPIHTFPGWQALGRHVKRNEKAIILCQPIPVKQRAKSDLIDLATARVGDGAERQLTGPGGIVPDESRVTTVTVFAYKAHWFVLSQTDGKPYEPQELPTWSEEAALESLGITRIPFTHLDGNAQGFARERSVSVSPIAFSPHRTLFHELAHVVLGHTAEGSMRDDDRTPRNIREVEAEGVALICCESLGLPGSEFSRGYLQHWLADEKITDKSARRSLTEGTKPPPPPIDPQREREFVQGAKSTATLATTSPHSRVPISTRIRSEYAEALKRASLERQLAKVEPNTLQDILEQAIEPWLRNNGYIR